MVLLTFTFVFAWKTRQLVDFLYCFICYTHTYPCTIVIILRGAYFFVFNCALCAIFFSSSMLFFNVIGSGFIRFYFTHKFPDFCIIIIIIILTMTTQECCYSCCCCSWCSPLFRHILLVDFEKRLRVNFMIFSLSIISTAMKNVLLLCFNNCYICTETLCKSFVYVSDMTSRGFDVWVLLLLSCHCF